MRFTLGFSIFKLQVSNLSGEWRERERDYFKSSSSLTSIPLCSHRHAYIFKYSTFDMGVDGIIKPI